MWALRCPARFLQPAAAALATARTSLSLTAAGCVAGREAWLWGRQWAAAVGGRISMNGGLALPSRASQHDDNFSTKRERSHGDNSVFCVREMANPNEEPYFFRSLSMLSPRSLCLAIALSWSSTLHGGFWGLQSVFFFGSRALVSLLQFALAPS